MYRRVNAQPVGMSGLLDSIFGAVKSAVSGIRITAPPYQIPGTTPPAQIGPPQPQGSATPDWLMPVALGGVGLLAVMMLANRGRR